MREPPSTRTQVIALACWLLLAFAAAAVGGLASVDAAAFYAQLQRPAWAPPASVFGPVWTVLYLAMGVAAWLVWRAPGPHRGALSLFAAQLVANALWSWLFFGWRQGGLAAVEVLLLLALVAATAIAFFRTSRLAGLLMAPYVAWVAFASALTWAIWRANPAPL